ncbi:hypothetical protein HK102_009227 [Quaeritorhiza haematococci]|nr:hypothetical protein HK102_009227 [Quaeritorhiza haematococci]
MYRKCATLGIERALFQKVARQFSEDLLHDRLGEDVKLRLSDVENALERNVALDPIVFQAFYRYLMKIAPDKQSMFESLFAMSDLSTPAEWYIGARQMRRKIFLHVGPTNSGKTYTALQRLEKSSSSGNGGIYCGPLRLLAHEIYDRLNRKGIACNLITGEQRKEIEGVNLYACTVEMALLNRRFDVAVVDEIQMISDQQRGWAWTQALLGLQADEIHLCGEPSAVDLIKTLCESTGDEVEVTNYERLTPLTVQKKSLDGNLGKVQKGDAVITFSRSNIFAVKRQIEALTKWRVAVIYGNLPPETRAEQAKLFNDPQSPYDVLVSSDAVGMGLNLNIRRVVFERLEKFDGESMKPLSPSAIKQIAGRAGRFNTEFSEGFVTTLDSGDLTDLAEAMETPIEPLQLAGLSPHYEQLEAFAEQLPKETFSNLLSKFEHFASMENKFFLCNLDTQKQIADLINSFPLTLRDRYTFVLAPINLDMDGIAAMAVVNFARARSKGVECQLDSIVALPSKAPSSIEELRKLECQHRVIMLYLWLSYRFPETFTDTDTASHFKNVCEDLINQGLLSLNIRRSTKTRFRKRDMDTNFGAGLFKPTKHDGTFRGGSRFRDLKEVEAFFPRFGKSQTEKA